MKLKAKHKDCQLLVKMKLSSHEEVDEKKLDHFSRICLRGFLKPKLVKKRQIEYTGPIGISLYDRFKQPVSKRDFLLILEQVVVAILKLRANDFGINCCIMNLENVYINEVTKEVQFIYVPIVSGMQNMNLIEFLETISYSVRPANEKDTDFVSRFVYFLRAMKPFDIEKVEKFVESEDRSVVNIIRKQNAGLSGFMTDKHKHYYDHYKKNNDDEATGLLSGNGDDEATGLLSGNGDDEATGLLSGNGDDEATGLLSGNGDDEATGLLSGNGDDEATGLLVDKDSENINFTERTTAVRYPTLFRVLTKEQISVDKPVFRLGKERSYVDYFVTNNVAVSRGHVDIIRRGNRYFVKDLNSKNGTYINNYEIPPHTETEIQDGDSLKLANEEFLFNINDVIGAGGLR